MLNVMIRVRLTLLGPILSHSTAMGAIGIDSPMARLGSNGPYFLPFSLVRGKLRQAWEELHAVSGSQFNPDADGLLGAGSGDVDDTQTSSDFSPRRGRLHFTDFTAEENVKDPGQKTRVRMDSKRGAAHLGSLQVLEVPFAPGKPTTFAGSIHFLAADEGEARSIAGFIERGLRWTTSFGAERTSGFGRLSLVEVVPPDFAPFNVSTVGPPAMPRQVLPIAITFSEPFCVAKRQIVRNLFESEVVISGAVLRGALAESLKTMLGMSPGVVIDGNIDVAWRALGQHFNLLKFSYAFPTSDCVLSRPVWPPLSLVKPVPEGNGSRNLYDVALCARAGLIGNPPHAPSFTVDWKSSDDVLKDFGWSKPDRELRVRTAIDLKQRRAKDQQLFAYEMVLPKGHHWLAYVDMSQLANDPQVHRAVETQLCALVGSGMLIIGKTKARADIRVLDADLASSRPSNTEALPNNQWVITLQTPALLGDPQNLNEESGEKELHAAYDTDWNDLSGGALKLVRFFATQSLAGGYLSRRFQRGKPYNPFLLTDAGSVFVLQAVGDVQLARHHVEQWAAGGLPLPKWALACYTQGPPETHWQTCPFLPADGFGEVAVNLSTHTELQPGGSEWHDV